MPVVFGEMVSSIEEIVAACDRYGDRLRGTYRAHYRFDATTIDPYTAPRLERPEALAGNPPDAIYPWEQIFLAAAFDAWRPFLERQLVALDAAHPTWRELEVA